MKSNIKNWVTKTRAIKIADFAGEKEFPEIEEIYKEIFCDEYRPLLKKVENVIGPAYLLCKNGKGVMIDDIIVEYSDKQLEIIKQYENNPQYDPYDEYPKEIVDKINELPSKVSLYVMWSDAEIKIDNGFEFVIEVLDPNGCVPEFMF
jgi:hypothetical protein